MAFKLTDLSVLAYANNFTLWHYTTPDTGVDTDGYFNNGADMMRKNDLIIANIETESSPKTKFYIVTSVVGGVVKVVAYS